MMTGSAKIMAIVAILWANVTVTPLPADPRWAPEGRRRVLELTRWLEAHPLGDVDKSKRAEVLKWWIDVPDLTLSWCSNLLLDGTNQQVQPLVVAQGMFGAGAYLIEYPEKAADKRLLALAGVRGALVAYRNAIAADVSYRDALYDSLLSADRDKLERYVDRKLEECAVAEAAKRK